MIPANIELQLDKRAIQQHIEKQLDEAIQSQLWFVDVEKMAQLCCMSKRWIEMEILPDPRMKLLERRRNRKKWYPASKALEVINEITEEW
ncbi:hypothetical protein [Lysinibacillus capsici]|uniref:hypothetical protein n=1 Tax=Lysinibacillus capsici TaxID=2115968 RepID=UPI0028A69330|nr:hypothetical protein [Lysinibacillus capsici]